MANEREPTKVAIFGAQGVGKTAIVNRMVYDAFTVTHTRTMGVDFLAKTIAGRKFRLWDTGGHLTTQPFVKFYATNAQVLMFVWDAQPGTLNVLNDWLKETQPYITPDTHVLFIRNKVDSDKVGEPLPALSWEEVNIIEGPKGFVETYKIAHYAIIETSAKNNTGLNTVEAKMLEAPEPASTQKQPSTLEVADNFSINSSSYKPSSTRCNFFKAPIVQMGSGALIAAAGLAAALTSKQLAAWLFLKLLALATIPPTAATVLLVIGIALIAAGALLATNGAKNMICRPSYASV